MRIYTPSDRFLWRGRFGSIIGGFVKKCASCTKDLPDAALHCVFCGAKQAPAPVGGQPLAKTVMGNYSASDVIEQLKAQGQAPGGPRPPIGHPSATPAPMPPVGGAAYPPAPAFAPANAQASTLYAPGPPPNVSPTGGGMGGMPGGGMPPSGGGYHPPPAHSPAPMPPAPAGAFPPMAQPMGAPRMAPPMAPMAQPIVGMVPQYQGAQNAAHAGRPIEPWKDGLRLMMFIWGGLLVLAFVVPLSLSPLRFNWDLIADAPGRGKIGPLLLGAAGLLSILFAALPLATLARGVLALLVGLAATVIPLFLGHDVPHWSTFATVGGLTLIIPGLLLRDEYRESLLPRLLVTIGVAGALLPYLVPRHGEIGIVQLFRALLESPGEFKIFAGIMLGYVVLLIVSLLVWLPSPATGGAKIIMWLLIVFPAIFFMLSIIISGKLGALLDTPNALLWWASGAPGAVDMESLAILGIPSAYGVLIAYGGATTLGKQLE